MQSCFDEAAVRLIQHHHYVCEIHAYRVALGHVQEGMYDGLWVFQAFSSEGERVYIGFDQDAARRHCYP